MQLILRATGCPAGVSIVSRAFGLGGGTIGRNPDCTLALPDPLRYISRVHAEIRQKDGGFFLKVLSKINPVIVSGSPVGFNQMVELKTGDTLSLAEYRFVAEISDGEPAAQDGLGFSDPFAMFDGLSPSHGSAGEAFQQDPFFQEQQPDDGPSTVLGGFPSDKGGSLADMVQSPPSAADDPLLNILQSGDAKAAGKGAAGRSPARPADSGNASIDQFLGVGGSLESGIFGAEKTPQSETTLPGAGGLGGHGDHVLDINLPFNAPARKGAAAKPAPEATPPGQFDDSVFADLLGALPNASQPAPPPPQPGAPPDDLFSVLDGLIEPAKAAKPTKPAGQPEAARPQVSVPPVEAPQVSYGGQGGMDLIAKLAEGLNMPGLKVPPAEAEAFMVELGQMFRTAVEGVHTLLLLRAEVKKELRAEDRTMIASRENNPLKHTETVEEALNYLLSYGAPNPAFLSPARAMEDAFKDMRAHELAVMAGMRAGLAGVLKRFDPKALEPRIKKAGAFDSVVPALYKAKLWDTYTEFYKDIESEAEDHFDKLFGREFVRAYMEQTKQLKKSKKS